MERMVVVTTPELAPGFRLAGVRTQPVRDARQAALALERLCADPETGVIGVHEPLLGQLDGALRRRLELQARPVVVALPAGEAGDEAGRRRARLTEWLQRVVGYRISFRAEEP